MVLAGLVVLASGFVALRAHRRVLSPGPSFAFYWAAAMSAPFVVRPDFLMSNSAVWYMAILVLSFVAGTVVGRPPVGGAPRSPVNGQARRGILRWGVVVGTVAGLGATILIQTANGVAFGDVLTLSGLMESASHISVLRYTGGLNTPAFVPLLLSLTYAACIIAPFAAERTRGLARIGLYVAPVVSASVYAVVTTARAGMLIAAGLVFASWIVARLYATGDFPRLTHRRLRLALGAAGAVGAVFVFAAFLRVGSFDPEYQRKLVSQFEVYGVGHLSTFSQWFSDVSNGPPTWPTEWGGATFAGAAKNLGLSEIYGEPFTDVRTVGFANETSNVFTAWRFLIADFGLIGAPLLAAAGGFTSSRLVRHVVRDASEGAAVLLIGLYTYVLNSVTVSAFVFTNVCFAFAIAYLVLRFTLARGRGGGDAAVPPPLT